MRIFYILVGLLITVSGWNGEGHKIVARIAARLLAKKTKRFVKLHLPRREGSSVPHAESALVLHASWADSVSSSPEYEWSRTMHFVDTPFPLCDAYEEERDCREGTCVVTAIANYTSRAADIALTHGERAEALKFLVHLVADAHSGMHVGFEQDHGGNAIHLLSPSMSLHEVWDTYLLQVYKNGSADQTLQSWPRLSSKLLETLFTDPDLRSRYELPVYDGGAFAAAIVSETAQSVTCPLGYKDSGLWIPRLGHVLSDAYLSSRAVAVVESLTKAGVRLAQLLNSVAASYFTQENGRLLAVPGVMVGGAGSANPFVALEFDADNFVLDPESEAAAADADLEREEAGGFVADPAPKRKTRRRVKPSCVAAEAPVTVIDGVGIESVVLVKPEGVFRLTSGDRSDAKSDASWMRVAVQFQQSAIPTIFEVDPVVFSYPVTSRALEAVFHHLQGEPGVALGAPVAVKRSSAMDVVAAAVSPPAVWSAASIRSALVDDVVARRSFFERARAELVVQVDADRVSAFSLNSLKGRGDTAPQAWRFSWMQTSEWRVMLDAAVVDGGVSERVVEELVQCSKSRTGRANKMRLLRTKPTPMLTCVLPRIHMLFGEIETDMAKCEVAWFCEEIHVTDRGVYKTLDFVIRTPDAAESCVKASTALISRLRSA